MPLPDSLAARLDLFRATGYLHREHEELFTEPGWVQVLMGQGIMPRAPHPNADAIDPAALARLLDEIERGIAANVAAMPTHAELLRRLCAPQSPSRPAATMETAR